MSDEAMSPDESCTVDTCSLEFSYSSYRPTFLGNLVYAIVFAICLVAQLVYGFRHRTWGFTAAFFCGLLLEILGYVGRILMYYNPFKQANFMLYLVPLTIAPAFLSAGIYLCLARVVVLYASEGVDISRLKPRTYTLIFVACDFISLLLQAAGGAMASMADTKVSEDTGIHIMVAGLAFQVASMALFMGLAAEVGFRIVKSHKTKVNEVTGSTLFKRFLIAVVVATVCIFIRCVFRVAELSEGFNGKLANQQESFMVLEGLMMALAAIALTVYNPGRGFQGKWAAVNYSFWRSSTPASESEADAKA
ncbi:putative RTA1 domain protein [Lasiosphaeria ovina]|uniref:RTA1 domain protein n=1 Tax=Lasiosphaeria ovina TaxID=92902 RepID=A0AAE0N258_9PEZI|nr:putative RTA1 domain protein [Lasiosphaeria ovina]